MHKPSSLKDYLIATLMAASLIAFFSLYLSFRRGYLFDAPPTADTLYVFNKVLIGAGTVLLAFTFLIGPIVRYFDRFDKWLSYRKEIGIVGGFLAAAHAVISYWYLPLKFPRAWINLSSPEFAAGVVGVFLLVFLFILSFKSIIAAVNGSIWWFLQRWGLRAVIVATLVHVYVMKWNGWVKWWQQGGAVTPELAHPLIPGLGLLVTLFLTWVVIIRLYESIFLFRNCGFGTKEICMDLEIKARGRRFFVWSFWIYLALSLIVLVRHLIPSLVLS